LLITYTRESLGNEVPEDEAENLKGQVGSQHFDLLPKSIQQCNFKGALRVLTLKKCCSFQIGTIVFLPRCHCHSFLAQMKDAVTC
jgi:hypothetical protein